MLGRLQERYTLEMADDPSRPAPLAPDDPTLIKLRTLLPHEDPQENSRLQSIAADPFFARLLAFDLACPACGIVWSVRHSLQRARIGPVVGEDAWDPFLQQFACPACSRTYMLGILAWTRAPRRAGDRSKQVAPSDAAPDPRQSLRIRSLTGGRWVARRLPNPTKKTPQKVNRVLTIPCPCDPSGTLQGNVLPDPRCPLHGDAKPLSLEETLDRAALGWFTSKKFKRLERLRLKHMAQAREDAARKEEEARKRGEDPTPPGERGVRKDQTYVRLALRRARK